MGNFFKNIFPYRETFWATIHTLNYTKKKGVNKLDPMTFGMVFVGATGGTLLVLTALGKKIQINETMVKLAMETAKFGTILYLFHYVFKLFL